MVCGLCFTCITCVGRFCSLCSDNMSPVESLIKCWFQYCCTHFFNDQLNFNFKHDVCYSTFLEYGWYQLCYYAYFFGGCMFLSLQTTRMKHLTFAMRPESQARCGKTAISHNTITWCRCVLHKHECVSKSQYGLECKHMFYRQEFINVTFVCVY